MTIPVTTRSGKGSPLTNSDMDVNLINLARNSSNTVQGNVRLSTQAEVDAGTSADTAVPPNALQTKLNNLGLTNIVLQDAQNGHFEFGGILLNWGRFNITDLGDIASTSHRQSVVFSRPYPTTAPYVVLGGGNVTTSSIGIGQECILTVAVEDGTLTTTGADLLVNDVTTTGQIQRAWWLTLGSAS